MIWPAAISAAPSNQSIQHSGNYMLQLRLVFTIALTLFLAACGGGSSDSQDSGDSSNPLQKYTGKWKTKNFCVGPYDDSHPDPFVRGKYTTSIFDNAIDANGNLATRSYGLVFNNPMCTGIGELSADSNTTNERLSCATYIETLEKAGTTFDKVGRCDLKNATSLQRISNGEMELTDNEGAAGLILVRYL
jgi:hypothetical protein